MTFLEQLKAAREATMPMKRSSHWVSREFRAEEILHMQLLVNNAEKIERLVEAVEKWYSSETKIYEGFHKKTSGPVFEALAALNGTVDAQ